MRSFGITQADHYVKPSKSKPVWLWGLLIAVLLVSACTPPSIANSPKVADRNGVIEVAQAGAPFIQDLAISNNMSDNPQAGETYILEVQMPSGMDVLWGFGWCTKTQLQIAENWENMDFSFKVNGLNASSDHFLVTQDLDIGLNCRRAFTALTDWPIGEHVLIADVTYQTEIDDGFAVYDRGTFTVEYHVTVLE